MLATLAGRGGSLQQTRLLSQALALEEHEPPHVVFYGVAIILGLILLFLGGAAVMPVVTSADAVGIVTPIGSVRPVQHLEGGTVGAVLVREGDFVEQGQPILRLSSEDNQKRLEEVDAQYFAYVAEAARLDALVEGRTPDFASVPGRHRDMASAQESLYRQTLLARKNHIVTLVERQRQAEAQEEVLSARLRGMAAERALMAEQLAIYEELVGKGYASKVRYIEAQRELSSVVSAIAETKAELKAARSAIAEAKASIPDFESNAREEALDSLGEISGTMAQVRATLGRVQGTVHRLEITSPQTGIVSKLKYRSAGSVIPPGDVIAEIVPTDEALIVQAKVIPRDIGFLEIGQKAKLVVDGFDVSKYSALVGVLINISATSILDDNGEYFFHVDIAVNISQEENSQLVKLLRPGMVVSASIITGERTFLRYLMRPVVESVESVFSER